MKTKSKFKNVLLVMAAGSIAMLGQASAAITLSTLSPYYLGSSSPGLPSNPTNEVLFINTLIGLALNGSTVVGGDTVVRSNINFGILPTATVTGDDKVDPASSYTFNGFSFIVAKYGAGGAGDQRMEFYYTAGLTGAFEVSPTQALSHVSYYNPSSTPPPRDIPGVPDGGTTLVLLGGSLLGLGSMRRLMLKKA